MEVKVNSRDTVFTATNHVFTATDLRLSLKTTGR